MKTVNQLKRMFFICFMFHAVISYSMIQQKDCAQMTYEEYQSQHYSSSSQASSSFFGFVKKLTDCLTQSPQSASLSERLIPRIQAIIGTGLDIFAQKDLTNHNETLRYPKNLQEGRILRDAIIAIVTKDVGNIPFFTAYFSGSYPSALSPAEKEYRIKLFTLITASQFLNKRTSDSLFKRIQAYAKTFQNIDFINDFNLYCPNEARFYQLVGSNFVPWFNQTVFGRATSLPHLPLYPPPSSITRGLRIEMPLDQYHRKIIFSDDEYAKELAKYEHLLTNIPAPTYIPFDANAAQHWVLAPTLQHTAVVIDKNNSHFGNVAATQNVRYCVNVSFHNPKNQKAGQAHLDVNTNITSLYPAIFAVRGIFEPSDVTITLTSSYMSDRLLEIYSKIMEWGYTIHFIDVSYDQSGSLGNNKNTFFMRSTGPCLELIYPYHAYPDFERRKGPFSTIYDAARHLAITAGNGSLIYLPNESMPHTILRAFETSISNGVALPPHMLPTLTQRKDNYTSANLAQASSGPYYEISGYIGATPTSKIRFHYHELQNYLRYRTDLLYLNNPELQAECEKYSYIE